MDTSALPHPKPKAAKRSHPDAARDRRESEKVKKRSRTEMWPDGQCEVHECHPDPLVAILAPVIRCSREATQVMHLIGGNGKRGRGISALKEHKLHACAPCHKDIDGDIGGRRLVRVGGSVPVWTDPYKRVR